MHIRTSSLAGACVALLLCTAAHAEQHILWSLQGKTNKVYLLGSIHMLQSTETLPPAIDTAYTDAEKLIMEIDMDDLDTAKMQLDVAELAMQPQGHSLQQQVGPEVYAKLEAEVRTLSVDPALLDRFKARESKISAAVITTLDGYLPTHITERCQTPGPDPVWNFEHCRNRRILMDETTRRACESDKPAMLSTYRMELGDKFLPVKNVFVPIYFKGKRWGNFELAYVDE